MIQDMGTKKLQPGLKVMALGPWSVLCKSASAVKKKVSYTSLKSFIFWQVELEQASFIKDGPFPASFSLFSSFLSFDCTIGR